VIELVIALNVSLLTVIGFIEFSVAVNQWNLAAKAVQVGARLAAMPNPVDSAIDTWIGLTNGLVGDPITSDYDK